jgi:hypothetical protein
LIIGLLGWRVLFTCKEAEYVHFRATAKFDLDYASNKARNEVHAGMRETPVLQSCKIVDFHLSKNRKNIIDITRVLSSSMACPIRVKGFHDQESRRLKDSSYFLGTLSKLFSLIHKKA